MNAARTAASAAVVGVAGLAGTLNATATVIPQLTVEQVFDASDEVVHGRVVAQKSQWERVNGNRLIFTYTDVEVYSSIKGNGKAKTRRVRTVGGNVDGYNQALIGEAVIRPGEEVVLFLGREPGWKQPAVVGFYQGKYGVDHTVAMGTHVVRDLGAEAGSNPKLDRVRPADEFVSELNRIANRSAEERRGSDFVPLTKRVEISEMSGDMAMFARTVSRGTRTTDVNADGIVDRNDLIDFADGYASGLADADTNADGVVDLADLELLIDDLNR